MKLHERINCILLGTLWLLAIVLVLDFWLNTAYNFNMFSNAHWQYIANLQASNHPIKTDFYVAITLAIVAMIVGMYVLFRPRFRRILLASPAPVPEKQPEPIKPVEQMPIAVHTQPTIQRPAHLHIQHNAWSNPPKTTQINIPAPQPKKTSEPRYMHEIQEIFEKNGYKVLKPTRIANVPLSLIALGTNETLWLGACDISHEQMADTILAFKKVFQDTLEDIEIDINAFIINPTDNDKTDAILDCNSLEELSNAMSDAPNTPESDIDTESENMDAFTGYIETVITYLGQQ